MKQESINKLQTKLISTYKKLGDKKALITKGKTPRSYTGNELAKEVEGETEFGLRLMSNVINLTVDLLSRDKINSNL